MADDFIQVAPDSTGKKVDNSTVTTSVGSVERQRVSIGDAAANNNAAVTAGGALKVDGSAVTQPVSEADGAAVTVGAIADAAVSTDATGTVNAHLRGIVKLLAAGIAVTIAAALDITDRAARLVGHVSLDTGGTLVGQKTSANSVPVVIASDQTAVPISAASLPLPAGAALDASLTTIHNDLTAQARLIDTQPVSGAMSLTGDALESLQSLRRSNARALLHPRRGALTRRRVHA